MATDADTIDHLDWAARIPCGVRLCGSNRGTANWIIDSVCDLNVAKLACDLCRIRFMLWVGGQKVTCQCGWRGRLGDHVFFEWLW